MSMILMPSQSKIYKDLQISKSYKRRKNQILFGSSQIGKTTLAKYLADNVEGYKYINFTEKFLNIYLNNQLLSNINFNYFQEFMRENIDYKNQINNKIILDEIDSVITLISNGNINTLLILYKQLLEMDLATQFIFTSSIFDEDILNDLISQYGDQINFLKFRKEDKEHIIKHHLNNINLYDFREIINVRQLINT